MHREQVIVMASDGRGTYPVTDEIARVVAASGTKDGMVNVFLRHTSASLLINENADPDVRRDLDAFLARLVPDGDPLYFHTAEGDDDMPAHVRTALTTTSLTLPFENGRLSLGTWQGIYLWEHRAHAQRRTLTVSVW